MLTIEKEIWQNLELYNNCPKNVNKSFHFIKCMWECLLDGCRQLYDMENNGVKYKMHICAKNENNNIHEGRLWINPRLYFQIFAFAYLFICSHVLNCTYISTDPHLYIYCMSWDTTWVLVSYGRKCMTILRILVS